MLIRQGSGRHDFPETLGGMASGSLGLYGLFLFAALVIGASAGCSSSSGENLSSAWDGPPPLKQPPSDTTEQLKANIQRLTSAESEPPQRRSAALYLLNQNDREAQRALLSALEDHSNPAIWQAVAAAVAINPNDPPKNLAWPLMNRLGGSDPQLDTELAEALGRIDDDKLIKRLIQLAINDSAPIGRRRSAVQALGHHRRQKVVSQLIKLTELSEPDAIQNVAFSSLGVLTGLDTYGHDRQAWLDWWSQSRKWSQDKWQDWLLHNMTRRSTFKRARQRQIEDRLLESQRELYRATTAEDRPGVLTHMLGDPLESIRLLAMDLADQRLLDNLPFDEPVSHALRARLIDPLPSIRQRSSALLRDLGDAAASELVAQRLALKQETVVTVLKAYLLMMTRLPRPDAVEPALELMNQEWLRDEAAGALAAAAEEDLLNKKQQQRAIKIVRHALQNQAPPRLQLMRLMGAVGDDQDWHQISQWVDSSHEAVKQAAATVWADSTHSLNLLAKHVDDPIIRPIVLVAATRRGTSAQTFRTLAEYEPKDQAATEGWQRALLAMARRVPHETVLKTVQHLEYRGDPALLQQGLITAALTRDQATPLSNEGRIALLLQRGKTLLNQGNAASALADFEQVQEAGVVLSVGQQETLLRGLVRANLMAGNIDPAFEAAGPLLARADLGQGPPPTDDPAIELFLESAHRYSLDQQTELACSVLMQLRLLLGPQMKSEVAERIALVEVEIGGCRPSEPPIGDRPEQTEPAEIVTEPSLLP